MAAGGYVRDRLWVTLGGVSLLGLLASGCGAQAEGGAALGEDAALPASGGQGLGAPEAHPERTLVVEEDGARVHEDCDDREVLVRASDATVILDGACGLVKTTGRGSTVEVGSADKIIAVGVDNRVQYASGDPEVVNRGRNTTVSAGGSAAA